VIHSEVVTTRPRVKIRLTASTVLQILEEDFHNCDGTLAVQRWLLARLQQVILVLLDERGVKDSRLEG